MPRKNTKAVHNVILHRDALLTKLNANISVLKGFSLRRRFVLTLYCQSTELLSYNKVLNCTCLWHLMSTLMNGFVITFHLETMDGGQS